MEDIIQSLEKLISDLEDLDNYIDECELFEAESLYETVLTAYTHAKQASFRQMLKGYEPEFD